MTTHRIRLHGAWTVTELGPDRVRHARRFGRPRHLDPGESAWVVCDWPPGPGEVRLNGEPLGPVAGGQPFAYDVTPRLLPRNELSIEVEAPADVPPGDVALEIRGAP